MSGGLLATNRYMTIPAPFCMVPVRLVFPSRALVRQGLLPKRLGCRRKPLIACSQPCRVESERQDLDDFSAEVYASGGATRDLLACSEPLADTRSAGDTVSSLGAPGSLDEAFGVPSQTPLTARLQLCRVENERQGLDDFSAEDHASGGATRDLLACCKPLAGASSAGNSVSSLGAPWSLAEAFGVPSQTPVNACLQPCRVETARQDLDELLLIPGSEIVNRLRKLKLLLYNFHVGKAVCVGPSFGSRRLVRDAWSVDEFGHLASTIRQARPHHMQLASDGRTPISLLDDTLYAVDGHGGLRVCLNEHEDGFDSAGDDDETQSQKDCLMSAFGCSPEQDMKDEAEFQAWSRRHRAATCSPSAIDPDDINASSSFSSDSLNCNHVFNNSIVFNNFSSNDMNDMLPSSQSLARELNNSQLHEPFAFDRML